MLLRRLLPLALATLALHAPATGQQTIGAWEYDKGATKLSFTGVFEPPPPAGYQPIRVEMTNGTTDRRSWSLTCSSNQGDSHTDSSFAVAIDPGKATSTMVLVPLSGTVGSGGRYSFRYGGHHQLNVSASSPQVGLQSNGTSDERAVDMPAIAISDQLARKNLTQLNDEVRKSTSRGYGAAVFGSRFDPAMLPEDWLGFSGFDCVLLTDDEWMTLSPGARTALLHWTRLGGQLHLYRSDDSVTLASLGLPAAGTKESTAPHHGLGAIKLRSWNGDLLNAAATVADYKGGPKLVERLSGSYRDPAKWKLQRDLGERSFAGWQVVVFLLVFGVVVGPVNLFVLAPAGRRHKLFLTTPLIAAAASLLLMALILIQDGTGGTGRRFVAIQIVPDDAMAYVTQEQISRTGVLMGSAFATAQPAFCHQVVLQPSPWTKFHAGGNSQGMDVGIDGTRFSGNWFQSRTVQGQYLRTTIPTRGRIELVPPAAPDQPPAIVSSLDTPLTDFAYVDDAGQAWKAPTTVTKGVRTVLEKSDGAGGATRISTVETASEPVRNAIVGVAGERSTFIATATAAPGLTIESLDSIRWIDQIVVFGKLEPKH